MNQYSQDEKNSQPNLQERYWHNRKKAQKNLQESENNAIQASGVGINIGGVAIARDRESRPFFVFGKPGGGKRVVIRTLIQQALDRGSDKVILYDPTDDLHANFCAKKSVTPIIHAPWEPESPVWDIAKDCKTSTHAELLVVCLALESEGASQDAFLAAIISMQGKEEGWNWCDIDESLQSQNIYIPAVQFMSEAWKNAKEFWSISDFLQSAGLSPILALKSHPQNLAENKQLINGITTLAAYANNPTESDNQSTLWLFLEEMSTLGATPFYTDLMKAATHNGVRVVLSAQSISQLDYAYGSDDANKFLKESQNFIFADIDDETIKWATEVTPPYVQFNDSLDRGKTGILAIYWKKGGDAYRLLFPFQ